MEEKKEMKEGLFKVRSYLGCLNEGIKLPTRNFIPLLRFLYPSLVIAVLVMACGVFLSGELFAGFAAHAWTKFWLYVNLFSLLSFLCFCFYWGQLSVAVSHYVRTSSFEGLRPWAFRKELAGAFGRACTVLGVLWCLNMIVADASFFLVSRMWHLLWLLPVVLLALALAVGVPYQMVVYDYTLDVRQGFRKSLSRMKEGYKNWGAFFVVMLCGGFLFFVVMLVGGFPFSILMEVKNLSLQAVAMGDPTDVPSSFPVMVGVTAVISVLFSYMGLWFVFFPLSYLYGSVEAGKKEKERYEAEEQHYDVRNR